MKVSESKCVNSSVFEFFVSFPNVETKKIFQILRNLSKDKTKKLVNDLKKDFFLTSTGSTKVSRRDA